jgi:luciferase family oxidoreductase group 1
LAHIAANTTKIRLGAGGVMLPNHAPLVIAEQFGTLEALHRGRIDLGLGRAPGTDPLTARALGRGNAEGFPDEVVELLSYFAGVAPVRAIPGAGDHPEVWLLGSSTYSAQLAAYLGLPFSFAYHFAPDLVEQALAIYRKQFRPSTYLDAPYSMVAVTTLCAETTDEADYLAGPLRLSTLHLRTGRPQPMSPPEVVAKRGFSADERELLAHATAAHVVGDPESVAQGLERLSARTQVNELMISTRAFSLHDRIQSLQLTASVMGLHPPLVIPA